MLHAKGLTIAAAAAALLWAAHARADDNPVFDPPAQQDATVGVGVLCNTSEQAEHFISLRAAGQDIVPAVQNVNAEAQHPRACGVAAVAFMAGKTMDTRTVNGRLLRIVQVTVIAGYDGTGWRHVADAVQYAIVEADGYAI